MFGGEIPDGQGHSFSGKGDNEMIEIEKVLQLHLNFLKFKKN